MATPHEGILEERHHAPMDGCHPGHIRDARTDGCHPDRIRAVCPRDLMDDTHRDIPHLKDCTDKMGIVHKPPMGDFTIKGNRIIVSPRHHEGVPKDCQQHLEVDDILKGRIFLNLNVVRKKQRMNYVEPEKKWVWKLLNHGRTRNMM